MNTTGNDTDQFSLDELAYVELVDLAEHCKGLMEVGVELGSNVFPLKTHAALFSLKYRASVSTFDTRGSSTSRRAIFSIVRLLMPVPSETSDHRPLYS